MASGLTKTDFNVLASQLSWAWPVALRDIFTPRGVGLLVANEADEFVNIMEQKRIHATIIDMDHDRAKALTTIKIIRMSQPFMPCFLLAQHACEGILEKALELEVFSVIDKPVDLEILQNQLNRLFIRKYNSDIFA
ncbi:MAG: response regulator [Planctomycetes bacterium]|nr:response regulator [Planctomycetota bacterium]